MNIIPYWCPIDALLMPIDAYWCLLMAYTELAILTMFKISLGYFEQKQQLGKKHSSDEKHYLPNFWVLKKASVL